MKGLVTRNAHVQYESPITGIDLGHAIAILTLIFPKCRREKTVWGQFGASKLNLALIVKYTGSNKRAIIDYRQFPLQTESKSNTKGLQSAYTRLLKRHSNVDY